jgi:tryptophan-rich sensory protein
MEAIPSWYATLAKPSLNPPNWLFGPVWTILYGLMAVAAWRVYEKRSENEHSTRDIAIYLAHLVVNTLWSIVFFGLQNPLLAFAVIVVLWLMIVYITLRFYRVDRAAGLLFLPYIVWVSFAAYLNISIVLLN